jgi:gamma-glutamyltranspeptidase/glutathione hydrolase
MARRVAEASVPAGGGLTVEELRASVPRVAPPVQVVRGTDTISFLPADMPGGQASADAFAGQAPAAAGPLPASAGLVVVDRNGMAVSCAFTMNNLFGTGRVAPGTGILLAAAPGIGQVRPPLLAAGIAHVPNTRAFRAAAAGSGQAAAPVAVGGALAAAMRGADATTALAGVPEPGRGLLVTCPRTLPGVPESCTAAADPRGAGLALGSSER